MWTGLYKKIIISHTTDIHKYIFINTYIKIKAHTNGCYATILLFPQSSHNSMRYPPAAIFCCQCHHVLVSNTM